MTLGPALPRQRTKAPHEAVDDAEAQDREFMLSQSVPEKLRRAFYQPSV
jgi:hypothetical protein